MSLLFQKFSLFLVLFFSTNAFADSGFITGKKYSSPLGYKYQVLKTHLCRGLPISAHSHEENIQRVSCQTKKGIQAGLKATAVALTVANAACTVAPPQAKLFLGSSAALVAVVDLIVMDLPCEDRENTRKQVEQFCLMLRSQGFACDVNTIQVRDL